jgi:hypothetical protein
MKDGPRGPSPQPEGCDFRSLRTQQRARPADITPTVPDPKAVLNRSSLTRSLVKCSTHELPVENMRLESGAWTPRRVPDAP